MTVGIDISNGCVMEYYSETGSRITDQEASGKKNPSIFSGQCCLACGVLCAPPESPAVLLGHCLPTCPESVGL